MHQVATRPRVLVYSLPLFLPLSSAGSVISKGLVDTKLYQRVTSPMSGNPGRESVGKDQYEYSQVTPSYTRHRGSACPVGVIWLTRYPV